MPSSSNPASPLVPAAPLARLSPSRRTVLGAAWAAPVVVVAALAPAAAASNVPAVPVVIDSVTLSVESAEFYRVVFRIQVTGSGFDEAVSGSFETDELLVEMWQGIVQVPALDENTASGTLTLDAVNETGSPIEARLTVIIGRITQVLDYTHPG